MERFEDLCAMIDRLRFREAPEPLWERQGLAEPEFARWCHDHRLSYVDGEYSDDGVLGLRGVRGI